MSAHESPADCLTISQLARELGVDKSAVSRRVARLEGQGLLKTQKAGKTKLVNRAEFLAATSATVDIVRQANGRGATAAAEGGAADPVLAREQARAASIRADLAQIELDKQRRRLVEVEGVEARLGGLVAELAGAIDALPGRADELMAAVTKEGAAGLRAALRGAARELREQLALIAERSRRAIASEPGEAETVEDEAA